MKTSTVGASFAPHWMAAMEWLRCPRTGAKLAIDGERLVSRDAATRLAYPVRDHVPILLPDGGVELSVEDWTSVMARQP